MQLDAVQRFPDAKFYYNIEEDTYPFLPNLIRYLASMDPTQQTLLGSGVPAGSFFFAHGGSSYCMTRKLMQSAFEWNADHIKRVMFKVLHTCCGARVPSMF
jgi:hypothetical protein